MTSAPPRPGSVALIIATYDHAHFLESAVRSAIAQTVAADEIIVVDDGSNDDPEDVTERFPQVRLIRQQNAGLAAARNTGWRATSSEFVVFLDADDRLLPDALRLNMGRLAEHPAAGFAYGSYIDVDADTGLRELAEFRPAVEGYAAFLRENPIGMHGTVMYRRACLDEVGGFEAGLPACEDYDLYLRLAHRSPPLHGPEPLAEYWHHRGNMSRNSALMLRCSLMVLGRHEDEARRQCLLAAYRDGVLGWKRHYVALWFIDLLRAVRAKTFDTSLVRQGISLACHAPLTVMRAPFYGVRRAMRKLCSRFGSRTAHLA